MGRELVSDKGEESGHKESASGFKQERHGLNIWGMLENFTDAITGGSGAKREGSDIDLLEYKRRQHSSKCPANRKHGKELFSFGKMLKFEGAAIIQWNTSDVK
ncbi:hypothetical protein BDP27DRAFT_1366506 [Rhodocollybia butyracea]|uniref:Uncharacterized protein n=1 Tax=Rhodocollybia butyracea TaxID=206335 RepID=A0A9P5U318_9AGAR|nr:hypothetical protein BDP27DRAFT_1366506 [Rhodocollybia butyracea]